MSFFSRLRRNPLRDHILGASFDQADHASSQPPVQQSKTWETTVTRVPSWPEEAKPLKTHNWISYLYVIGDIILVLSPVYFILLGVAVLNLNGKSTHGNTFGERVEFAINLGPTLFPIVFAAIIGRSMKMIARYLAEKGATLGTLELLMASQSVWGTFESQLLLQRVTLVGANLLFLWALSPLGGQASLRLMTRGNHYTEFPSRIRYMSTGPGGTAWGMATTYEENGKFVDAAALYSAALMAPQASKLGHQDPWGNVKIPALEMYNTSTASEWFDLPPYASSPEAFSSLVGLPVVGLKSNASSSFPLETSYLTVDCQPFEQVPYPSNQSTNWKYTNWTKFEELVPGQVWSGKSSENNPFHGSSFFIDTDRPFYMSTNDPMDNILLTRLNAFFGNTNFSSLSNVNDTVRGRRGLLFASLYPDGDNDNGNMLLNIARCSVSQSHAEALVRCNGTLCSAERIRRSLSDARPSNYTGLEHHLMMYGIAQNFPIALPLFRTDPSPAAGSSSATERFLANSSSYPFLQKNGHPTGKEAYVDLSLVPAKDFSRRLGLLLNTYYQLSTQPVGYFGSLSSNLSLYGPDTLPATDIDVYLSSNLSTTNHSIEEWWSPFAEIVQQSAAPFLGATTAANVTTVEEIFTCNFAWLALLFASSGTIFITGAVALILKRNTLGPELFGFVTSMTYENPYVKIPEGGSTLDAMERARLLKDMKVYVSDVRGDKTVGHIALAAGVTLRHLERGRLYA